MTEARPHLVAVDGDRSDSVSSNALPQEASNRSGSGWLAWLLGALALVLGLGWGMSAADGRALQEQLVVTQGQLERSEARVGALESHLGKVESQTGALVDGMSGLMGQMRQFTTDLEALGSFAGSDPQATGKDSSKAPAER